VVTVWNRTTEAEAGANGIVTGMAHFPVRAVTPGTKNRRLVPVLPHAEWSDVRFGPFPGTRAPVAGLRSGIPGVWYGEPEGRSSAGLDTA